MTTTDPFTTAAVERANEQYGTPGNREVFLDAAEWARSYLAAQDPTDAERSVRELHRQYRVYEHEDACPDTTDEHREAHHHEGSDGYGENYCDQLPLYTLCSHCRVEDGERADWPCPTIRALEA